MQYSLLIATEAAMPASGASLMAIGLPAKTLFQSPKVFAAASAVTLGYILLKGLFFKDLCVFLIGRLLGILAGSECRSEQKACEQMELHHDVSSEGSVELRMSHRIHAVRSMLIYCCKIAGRLRFFLADIESEFQQI